MNQPNVTVRSYIQAKTFRNFALFDTFRLRKHWKSPAIFALILLVSALICFFSGRDGSLLIGIVLTLVGIGVPVVYVASYLLQLRAQIKRLKLKKPVLFYTVTMGKDIVIHNEQKSENDVIVPWDKIFGIWRGKDAFYLYVTPAKAFLLPDGCTDLAPDELWKWFKNYLPADKLHGKTK